MKKLVYRKQLTAGLAARGALQRGVEEFADAPRPSGAPRPPGAHRHPRGRPHVEVEAGGLEGAEPGALRAQHGRGVRRAHLCRQRHRAARKQRLMLGQELLAHFLFKTQVCNVTESDSACQQ